MALQRRTRQAYYITTSQHWPGGKRNKFIGNDTGAAAWSGSQVWQGNGAFSMGGGWRALAARGSQACHAYLGMISIEWTVGWVDYSPQPLCRHRRPSRIKTSHMWKRKISHIYSCQKWIPNAWRWRGGRGGGGGLGLLQWNEKWGQLRNDSLGSLELLRAECKTRVSKCWSAATQYGLSPALSWPLVCVFIPRLSLGLVDYDKWKWADRLIFMFVKVPT